MHNLIHDQQSNNFQIVDVHADLCSETTLSATNTTKPTIQYFSSP